MRLTRRAAAAAVAVATVVAAATMLPTTQANAVIGGVEAPQYYPYFVKVEVRYENAAERAATGLCGGSLIAGDWVLTAAHCFSDPPDDAYTYDQTFLMLTSGHSPSPLAIVEHPLFNGDTHDGHDLTLIRVSPGVTAGVPTVQVGAPGDPGAYASGTLATIMGYGRTSPGGKPSAILLAVDTVLRSDEYMDDMWNPWYWFDEWPDQFAIGAGAKGQTACNGDSGGPLVVYRNEVPVEVGVASFTKKSCTTAAGGSPSSPAPNLPGLRAWCRRSRPLGASATSVMAESDATPPATPPPHLTAPSATGRTTGESDVNRSTRPSAFDCQR